MRSPDIFGFLWNSFMINTYKLEDNRLSVKAMVNLGSTEFEHIEESFNRQFYKHIDWMYEAIEAGIRFNHDQATANAHRREAWNTDRTKDIDALHWLF